MLILSLCPWEATDALSNFCQYGPRGFKSEQEAKVAVILGGRVVNSQAGP